MKYAFTFGLVAVILSCQSGNERKPFKEGEFKTWAQTPPMGWNSWDCFGTTITEAQAKAQEAAAKKMGGLTGGLKIPGLT